MIRPKLQRNDKCIMDHALSYTSRKAQLERINAVREYLNIRYLSEICNPDGSQLASGILYGNKEDKQYFRRQKGPKQNKPNSRSWTIWRKFLDTLLCTNLSLRQSLGPWTKHHSTHGHWKSYILDSMVYEYDIINDTKQWRVYNLNGQQLNFQQTIPFDDFDTSTATPIIINSESDGTSYTDLTATMPQSFTSPIHQPIHNWNSLIDSQPIWVKSLLEEITFTSGFSNPFHIYESYVQHGHLITVSDGSVIFHNMSFGWILATPDGNIIATGAGPCNGRGNSLRSEGAGMLAVTVLISLILTFTSKSSIDLICVSDNQELINRMNEHKNYNLPPNETTRSEFDITEQIYRTSKAHNISSQFEWVRGHQDDNAPIEELPLYAQLNIKADQLAGNFQRQKGKFRPMTNILPSCPAMISIRGISVTSNIFKQLIRAYVEPRYIGHLQDKFKWNDSEVNIIAWKCLALAIQRIDRSVLITKICNDYLPTHQHLNKIGYYRSNKCPLCKADETTEHIIRCPAHSRTQWRCGLLNKLRETMKFRHTHDDLSETLTTIIATWMEHGIVDVNKFPDKYHNAINSQQNIGWNQLFMGRISQEWIQLYEDSYERPTICTKSPKFYDGYVWGAAIVETIIRQIIILWERRNKDIHGHDDKEAETLRKERLTEKAKELYTHYVTKNVRPSDYCLFPPDFEHFIATNSANQILDWITSRKRAIKNSVKKWTKHNNNGVQSVLGWLINYKTNRTKYNNLQSRRTRNFYSDGRQKECRRQYRIPLSRHPCRQTQLGKYFSLTRSS